METEASITLLARYSRCLYHFSSCTTSILTYGILGRQHKGGALLHVPYLIAAGAMCERLLRRLENLLPSRGRVAHVPRLDIGLPQSMTFTGPM